MPSVFATANEKFESIWVSLNQQNFEKAFTDFKNLDIDPLELSYENAMGYYNLLLTFNRTESKIFLEKILQKNPDFGSGSAFLVRKYGYNSKECLHGKIIAPIDHIEHYSCFLDHEKMSSFQAYLAGWAFVLAGEKMWQEMPDSSQKIQFASDLGNFLGYYSRHIAPKFRNNLFVQYQARYLTDLKRKFGEYIVEKDPSFVNGYFLLVDSEAALWNCERVAQLRAKLWENYQWDENRKTEVIEPSLWQYREFCEK